MRIDCVLKVKLDVDDWEYFREYCSDRELKENEVIQAILGEYLKNLTYPYNSKKVE